MSEPYPVELIDLTETHYLYQFSSFEKGDFIVQFTKATYYFNKICGPCQRLYEVYFFPVDTKKYTGYDPRIMITVTYLVDLFMRENMCPVLYICDSLDNKEQSRRRLFESWFKISDSRGQYQHDCVSIEWLDSKIYFGVIAFSWDADFPKYFQEVGIE